MLLTDAPKKVEHECILGTLQKNNAKGILKALKCNY
jgi:hypothetical protein